MAKGRREEEYREKVKKEGRERKGRKEEERVELRQRKSIVT